MRIFITLPALTTAFVLVGGPAEAPRPKWVQFQVGAVTQNNSICTKSSSGYGAGVGEWLGDRWGWEGSYLHSELSGKSGFWKAGEDHFHASALFRPFSDTGRWIPFLRAGLGASRLQSPLSLTGSTAIKANFIGAVGTQVILGPSTLGSLEVRSTPIETRTRRTEIATLIGVGYRWGAPAPTPAPPPVTVQPPPVEPVPAPKQEPVMVPATPPTPAPVAEPLPPALPKKIVLGEAILHFANNGSRLGPEGIAAIEAVAASLKPYSGSYTLLVSGHTSKLGSRTHNLALSLQRAQSVAQALIAAGIFAERIKTEGRGPDQPTAENISPEGQSRNRRVEIEIQTPEPVEKLRIETTLVEGAK